MENAPATRKPNTLSKAINSQPLSREVFDRAIAGLEAAKREDFPAESLNAWFSLMSQRGWTNGFFLEKVRGVLDSKQYGGVKFDSFIDGKGFYTESESRQMAEKIIERRKEQLESLNIPQKEIEQEGLINVQMIYARLREEAIKKSQESQKRRIKTVERFIRSAPTEIKKEIYKIVLKKNLCVADEFWEKIIHLFAAHVVDEVELIMKRNKE
jgi:hypothetical protein